MTEPPPIGESARATLRARGVPSRGVGPLTGVAAGLASYFKVDVLVVRIAFVVLGLTGVGALSYVLGYFLMPVAPHGELVDEWQSETSKVVGVGLVTTGAVLLIQRLGISALGAGVIWPLMIAAAGVGVVAWQLSVGRQDTLASAFQPNSTNAALRIGAGVIIVGGGIGAMVFANVSLSVLSSSVVALVLIIGGLAVVFGPWMWVLVRDLTEERRKRVRSDERADLAAHLHDSVLQTLALIQRTDDPVEAAQLARRQERELRSWLYARPDSFVHADVDLRSIFESAVADVENRHGVPIELVVVGDSVVDDSVIVLAKAAREAMVNASKFARSPHISVFVEAEDDQVEVWVRDTGIGFDPDQIDDDRRGVRDSILRRMVRAGGQGTITSSPGNGAEVYLVLPQQRKPTS
ncbi:MAG: ATP-binding protein [Acidimicrobiales bacterium]